MFKSSGRACVSVDGVGCLVQSSGTPVVLDGPQSPVQGAVGGLRACLFLSYLRELTRTGSTSACICYCTASASSSLSSQRLATRDSVDLNPTYAQPSQSLNPGWLLLPGLDRLLSWPLLVEWPFDRTCRATWRIARARPTSRGRHSSERSARLRTVSMYNHDTVVTRRQAHQ